MGKELLEINMIISVDKKMCAMIGNVSIKAKGLHCRYDYSSRDTSTHTPFVAHALLEFIQLISVI